MKGAGTAAAAAGLFTAMLLTAGCLSTHVEGSALRRQSEIPVRVRILSEPPGARVTDLSTGTELGTTPLEHEALVLRFEEWMVMNQPERRRRLLEAEVPAGEAALVIAPDPTEGGLQRRATSEIELRYRLEMPGRLPLVLIYRVEADDLPRLQREPLIVLEGRLEPARDP